MSVCILIRGFYDRRPSSQLQSPSIHPFVCCPTSNTDSAGHRLGGRIDGLCSTSETKEDSTGHEVTSYPRFDSRLSKSARYSKWQGKYSRKRIYVGLLIVNKLNEARQLDAVITLCMALRRVTARQRPL